MAKNECLVSLGGTADIDRAVDMSREKVFSRAIRKVWRIDT